MPCFAHRDYKPREDDVQRGGWAQFLAKKLETAMEREVFKVSRCRSTTSAWYVGMEYLFNSLANLMAGESGCIWDTGRQFTLSSYISD